MKKETKTHTINLIIIVLIIFLIFSFSLYFEEKIILKVDYKNREEISEFLPNDINNIELLDKIAIGQGWKSGNIYLYYYLKDIEELHISEGDYKLDELYKYVRNNGYSLDKIASRNIIVIVVILFILTIIKKQIILYNKNYWYLLVVLKITLAKLPQLCWGVKKLIVLYRVTKIPLKHYIIFKV